MENVPTGKIGETEKPISQEKVNEFAKLSWRERICYGAGDLAQNLIFGTIGSMLLFYLTTVFGISVQNLFMTDMFMQVFLLYIKLLLIKSINILKMMKHLKNLESKM